jgi:glucose 1-dehydrogenase
MKLQGKTALVTGSDSGIGQAIAVTFAREGADVMLHFRRDERGVQQTATQVRAYQRRAEVLQADFSSPEAAERFFDQAVMMMDKLDIVVNSAGARSHGKNSLNTDLETFMHVLNVDLVSPWAICRAAAMHMLLRGGGSIINITSVHEEYPLKGAAAYDAAKAGLRSITRTLALELAEKGVRINNIAPGMIDTPMTADTLSDPRQVGKVRQRIPMRRPGKPQEVANVALFLASDEASYVTGSSYFVDGGLTQNIGG